MNEEKAIALLKKYELGTISPEEKARLETWYLSYGAARKNQLSNEELEESFDHLKTQLPVTFEKNKTKTLWPRITIAAAAVAAIVFGVYFFNGFRQPFGSAATGSFTAGTIAPGTVGATLTLASGKKIRLGNAANGEIAREAGIRVTKTADGQLVYEVTSETRNDGDRLINTLTTARGETYQVRLPDGSMVWMNAASSLTYTARLNEDGRRVVKLSGEGYFEIAKDKLHPFIVESNGQQVQVLGTHFNINAYADEPVVKTTLLEGSVKIKQLIKNQSVTGKQHASEVAQPGNEVVLKPGQQSVLTADHIKIKDVDAESAVAWKNKQFLFESENIQAIMRMVERWYQVEVVYTGEITKDTFSGGVSRFDQLSEVLKSLESTGKVHFNMEGRKLYVSK